MSFQPTQLDMPVRQLAVFAAEQFRVMRGANQGDALGDASELVHDDVYELDPEARPERLGLAMSEDGCSFRIGPDSALGRAGAPVYLDALLTFMGKGGTLDALVFVEVDPANGAIAEVYLHPLDRIAPKSGYALVTIDRAGAGARLAASAMVAFTRGTRITMADGRQVPIEALAAGDRVLTRDSGPQEVRWIGMQTVRATGAFAPITIAAGALNNDRALVVSPNHRLFIYQRIDALGAGQKEILVKAGLLVNGTSVTQVPGGFVDYFQILLDRHEILYAEGIAAESQFLDTAIRPALPDEVMRKLTAITPDSAPVPGRELSDRELSRRPDAAAMLKRISAL
jgi:hypothetical protein